MELDESPLTGESLSVAKRSQPPDRHEAPLAERATMLYAGSTVARGRAAMVVTATAQETELGRIAELAKRPERATPLQRRLDRFAAVLLRGALALCLALALLAWTHGTGLADSVLIGVSLAVAAVPEGLPAVITVSLALGMRELARRGAIVRRLNAVEALGSVTVICTDKTGTLTENRMSVAHLWAPDGEEDLLRAALLASDPAGGPEDAAIAAAAEQRALTREAVVQGGRGRRRASLRSRTANGERHRRARREPDLQRQGRPGSAPAAARAAGSGAREACGRMERGGRSRAAGGAANPSG